MAAKGRSPNRTDSGNKRQPLPPDDLVVALRIAKLQVFAKVAATFSIGMGALIIACLGAIPDLIDHPAIANLYARGIACAFIAAIGSTTFAAVFWVRADVIADQRASATPGWGWYPAAIYWLGFGALALVVGLIGLGVLVINLISTFAVSG